MSGGPSSFVLDNSVLCGWFLPIRIDRSPPSPAALLHLAMRFGLTSYDAAYLELAMRLQLPIATRDHALADAAWAAGVGVLQSR